MSEYQLYLSGVLSESEYFEQQATQQPAQQATQQPASNNFDGNVSFQKLLRYLPGLDPVSVKNSIGVVLRGQEPNNMQKKVLGDVFIALLKASSSDTVQIMNVLKKVSMEKSLAVHSPEAS